MNYFRLPLRFSTLVLAASLLSPAAFACEHHTDGTDCAFCDNHSHGNDGYPIWAANAAAAEEASYYQNATNPPGGFAFSPDGTWTQTPVVNAGGVFAPGFTLNGDPRFRTAKTLVIYCHAAGTNSLATATVTPSSDTFFASTRTDYITRMNNNMRQWTAVNSGGKMDMIFDVIDSGGIGYQTGTTPWNSPFAWFNSLANAATYRANYDYIQLVWDDMSGQPQVAAQSASGVSSGELLWTTNFSRHHEFGHSFGLPHANDFNNKTTGSTDATGLRYTYNFVTKQYEVAAAGNNTSTTQMQPLTVGVTRNAYGNPVDVMAVASNRQYSPQEKAQIGWLNGSQFANVHAGANNSVQNIVIHDPNVLTPVISDVSGTQMGVAQGYGAGPYAAYFIRKAQVFVPNASGTGGQWITKAQVVDLNYVQVTAAGAYGIEFKIDSAYYGTLQLGQTINEKDFGNYLYTVFRDPFASGGGDTVYDISTIDTVGPDNPNRYRSSSYTITYASDGTDSMGALANLSFTTHLGTTATGLRYNTASGGNWSAATGWRDIDNANAVAGWSDGRHAVFGDPSLAAGAVTVTGAVNPLSLTFKPAASGAYTFTGGTINIGAGGINAEASATFNSAVSTITEQAWEILAGNALTFNGTLTATGNPLHILGSGTVNVNGTATFDDLNIYDATVASNSAVSALNITLYGNSDYRVTGGTLTLANNGGVIASPTSTGTLRLLRTDSTAASPELAMLGDLTGTPNISTFGEVSANVVLGTGSHYITAKRGFFTNYDFSLNNSLYKPAEISGDISGAGGINYRGAGKSVQLVLSGNNTFTGALTIENGSVHLVGANALGGQNVLNFNTQTGDDARLYLRGQSHTVKDLASTGAGSASIANFPAADNGGTAQASLTVISNNSTTFGGVILDTLQENTGNGPNGGSGYGSGTAGAISLIKQGSQTLTLTGANSYGGTTTVSAGILQIGNGGATGTLGSGAVTNNATLRFNRSDDITVANILSGNGTLSKVGANTLTLSGLSTNTGTTQVSAGTLLVTGALGNTAVTVSSGAALGGKGRIGEIASPGASVIFAGGSTLLADTSTAGFLDIKGDLTASGTTLIDFASAPSVGTYQVAGYTGTLTGGSHFSMNLRGSVSTATANQLRVDVTAAANLAWNGTLGNGNWGLKDSNNQFLSGITPDNFFSYDTVNMTDSATAKTVTLNGQLRPAALNVSNTAMGGAYTLQGSGSLIGSGTLTKSNTGTLIVANNNSAYSGAINITGGVLQLGNNGTEGSLGSGGVAIASGTSMITNRSTDFTLANAISGTGTVRQSGTGVATLTGDNSAFTGAFQIDAGRTLSVTSTNSAGAAGATYAVNGTIRVHTDTEMDFNQELSGNGIVLKTGAGLAEMDSGNSGFTGKFVVEGGFIGYGNSPFGPTGGAPVADQITLNGGGITNRITGGSFYSNVTLNAHHGITLGASGGTFRIVSSGGTYTVNSIISGTGALTKIDVGRLLLNGANTYQGGTTVSVGTVVTNHASALGTGAVSVATGATLQVGNGTVNGVTLGAGANLALATDAVLKLGGANAMVTMGAGGFYTLANGFNLDISGLGLGISNYTLITGTGAGNSLGSWSATSDLVGGDLANFSYNLSIQSNNLVLDITAIPEPGTYGLIGAASLALIAGLRRRRRTQ